MRADGVNKVFLIGMVSRVPKNHHDHWRFLLTTPEKYTNRGTEVLHEEIHVIHLPVNPTKLLPEIGQWVFVEGKIQTTMRQDDKGIKHYRTAVVALRLTFLRLEITSASHAALQNG